MDFYKQQRRMLWMGKFAFPKVDTRRTRIQLIPANCHTYNIPIFQPIDFHPPIDIGEFPKIDRIELSKWGYNGRRRKAVIRMAYYERTDTLLVSDGSFVYEHNIDFWMDRLDWIIGKMEQY